MKDHGWELYKLLWVIGGIIVSFPLVMLTPAAVPFIIGFILLWFGYKQLSRYEGVAGWQKSSGKLLNADIGIYRVAEDKYSPSTPFYFPMAHYSYCYQGIIYENNVYAFDRKSIWTPALSSVETTIDNLLQEENLVVYVNPVDPSDSTLNVSISGSRYSQAYSLLVSGFLVIILGVCLCAANS